MEPDGRETVVAQPKTRTAINALFIVAHKLKTLQHTVLFGISGVAFALGNLLLARTMPVESFGRVALAFALYNIFCLLAPIGLDQAVLRHRLDPGLKLGALILGTSGLIGGAVGLIVFQVGGLDAAESALLAFAIAAGGMLVAASGVLRAAQRSEVAVALFTGGNWIIMAIGGASLAFPMPEASWPLFLFGAGQACLAAIGWIVLGNHYRVGAAERAAIPWSETFSLLNVTAITAISMQFERLIIPVALDVRALAVFGVLASVAIFPFKMVTAGAAFAMAPQLRAESDAQARRRLVRRELISISVLLLIASIGTVVVAPFVGSWLTGGRYQLDVSLVLAGCASGSAMVLQALPRAVLIGCGSARELSWMSHVGWAALAIAVAGGFIGAAWGLTGLILGTAIGGVIGNLPAVILARRALR